MVPSNAVSILPFVAVDTARRPSAPLLPSFAGLTGYGELLRTLVRRELRSRYKGSALVIVVVVVPFAIYLVPENARTVALVVPFFLALVCLALGLSWMLSVANVFFRDIEHLLTVLFLPWFFLTPVLYGLDQLPAAASHPTLINLLRYGNPATPYVEGIRAVVLEATVPGPAILVYIFVVGPLVGLLGLWVG